MTMSRIEASSSTTRIGSPPRPPVCAIDRATDGSRGFPGSAGSEGVDQRTSMWRERLTAYGSSRLGPSGLRSLGREHAGRPGGTARFVRGDLRFMTQRDGDVVEAFEKPGARELIECEGGEHAGALNGGTLHVD